MGIVKPKPKRKTIKIKVEITNGKGHHKILLLMCNPEMRDEAIEAVERFMWCGMTEMEKSNSGLTV